MSDKRSISDCYINIEIVLINLKERVQTLLFTLFAIPVCTVSRSPKAAYCMTFYFFLVKQMHL